MEQGNGDFLIFAIVVGIAFIIHFVPSFLAFSRAHPSRKLILLINVLIGWTVIGWAALLYWSLKGGSSRALV